MTFTAVGISGIPETNEKYILSYVYSSVAWYIVSIDIIQHFKSCLQSEMWKGNI